MLLFLSRSPEYSQNLVDLLKLGQHSACDPRANKLLLSFSGINELDLAFNQLRTKALTILKKVWQFVITKQPQDPARPNETNCYIRQAAMIQNDMIETLMFVTQSKDFEQIVKNGYIDTFMKSALQCLTLFADNQRIFVSPLAAGITNPVIYIF